MHLSDDDIVKLGTLGRLALSPEQRQTYAEQLSRIVEYTERLAEADVAATSAHLRPAVPADHLREDIVVSVNADGATALAPKREGRFVVSPPIA
ncbi:MAG: Asp-tRNA(Asn)/Glu-tRNA(Gln) amidotransferase subunit GatC [Patescibacteria group bacterium]